MNWAKTRKWGYSVLTAAVPLLIAYGVIGDAVAPLWVAFGAAMLGTGTAAVNTQAD